MAVILQFVSMVPVEAHIPRDDAEVWWAKPKLFEERELGDSIVRPVEDAALANIYAEARALKHARVHQYVLTPTERQLLALEYECLRRNVTLVGAYNQESWIAAQMGGEWNARGVRHALVEISQILVAAENERITETLVKWGRRKIARREAAYTMRELVKAA